ncbi:MAG: flippase, partial [Nitrospirota bacterium]
MKRIEKMARLDRIKRAFPLNEDILALAKGTGITFLGEMVYVAVTYAYGITIARYLGAGEYGIFFLGVTVFNLVALLSQCGIEDGLMRFLGRYVQKNDMNEARRMIRSSFFFAIALGTVTGGICFFSADLLAERLFHKPELGSILRYLSLAVPIFGVMTVSVTSIRGIKVVMPYVFIRKIFFPVVTFGLSLALLVFGFGIRSVSIVYVLSLFLSASLAAYLLTRYLSPFERKADTSSGQGEYFSFVGTSFLVNVLIFLFVWSDVIVLGTFRSAQELGVYFAAKKTAFVINLLLMSLNSIFIPTISHLHSADRHDQLDHIFKISTRWMLILGLPLFLVISLFSREILRLFSPDFETGYLCLIILAFAQLVNISVGSVGYILMMTGHQRWMVFNAAVFAALAVFLNIVLVPSYGMVGAAYAKGISIILLNVVALAEVYALLKLHPYSILYFKALAAGLASAAVAYALKNYLPDGGSGVLMILKLAFVPVVFFAIIIKYALDDSERKILMTVKQ